MTETHAKSLLVEDRDGLRILTLNRPEKKNCITLGLAVELGAALAEAGEDEEVRVVVLRGAGSDFCAGVDVNVFLANPKAEEVEPLSYVDRAFTAFPKPLIAAVQGKAVGMGVTLLPHCDMVYAAEDASFTTPFVHLGLVLEYGSSFHLPRLIGRQRTNELILRATPVDAVTAERWGLVTRVFPADELQTSTLAIARDVASRPPSAVAACKRLIRQGEAGDFEESDQRERHELAQRYGSSENVAAVQAFLTSRQKRSR